MNSEIGKAVALTAKTFGFRPSHAAGLTHETQSLFFDVMAAGVAAEVEAEAYRGTSGSTARPMSVQHQKIIKERIKAQEIEAKKQEATHMPDGTPNFSV